MSHVVRMIDLVQNNFSSHGVSSFFMMNTCMTSMIVFVNRWWYHMFKDCNSNNIYHHQLILIKCFTLWSHSSTVLLSTRNSNMCVDHLHHWYHNRLNPRRVFLRTIMNTIDWFFVKFCCWKIVHGCCLPSTCNYVLVLSDCNRQTCFSIVFCFCDTTLVQWLFLPSV